MPSYDGDTGSAEPYLACAAERSGSELGRTPQAGSDRPGYATPEASFSQLVSDARGVFGSGVEAVASVAAEPGCEGVSPNLEESAYELSEVLIMEGLTRQTGVNNVVLEQYPDGWKATVFQSRDPVYKERLPREGKRKDESEQWKGSILRARCRVRHKMRCISADHLWTFTKRGKFESIDELWACWKEFCRLMSVRFPQKPWVYVAVPEMHSDGETWHLHVGVNGFWDVIPLRTLWYRALGGNGSEFGGQTPGSVNVKWVRGQRTARSVASYVAKYVGKGMDRMPSGRHLYSASKGIRAKQIRRYHFVTDVRDVDVVTEVERLLYSVSGWSSWSHKVYDEPGYWCVVFEQNK